MDEELYCQGCGVKIQTEHPDELGYTPKAALEREEVFCQRCFRMKHYNETQDVDMSDDDFLEMISQIRHANGLVVHLVDLFDVSGSFISSLPRIVGDNPILLVGNKIDLLPKSTNQQKLSQWLRSIAKDHGVRVTNVNLISSVKGHGVEELMQQIEYDRDGRDVYVVGTTNVGKSTFINRVIKQTLGVEDIITTSYFPGTTLGFIEIPLSDHTYLIDTPGIVNKDQIVHYVSKQDLKKITPQKEIKPRVYQLNSGQTLFVGGLARLDFIKGSKQSFVCYFSNQMPIHRTKLENADALYENHIGKLLSPPDEETLAQLPPLKAQSFRIPKGRMDIVFPGLGWISSVAEEDITVVAHSIEYVPVSLRKSFI